MRLSSVDLNLLVYLDALLEEGHVTNAGNRLGMSQSATSRALKRLRDLFDDDLLVKSHHGMSLTPLAQRLKKQVNQSLANIEQLIFTNTPFCPQTDITTFAFSADEWAINGLLPELIATIHTLAPLAHCKMVSDTQILRKHPHIHLSMTNPHVDLTANKTLLEPYRWVGLVPAKQTQIETVSDMNHTGIIGFDANFTWHTQWQNQVNKVIDEESIWLTICNLAQIPMLIESTGYGAIVPYPYAIDIAQNQSFKMIDFVQAPAILSTTLSWHDDWSLSSAQIWLIDTTYAWLQNKLDALIINS